jgi:hypothetical protein
VNAITHSLFVQKSEKQSERGMGKMPNNKINNQTENRGFEKTAEKLSSRPTNQAR